LLGEGFADIDAADLDGFDGRLAAGLGNTVTASPTLIEPASTRPMKPR
jgi:hypothetical protein